MTPSTTIGRMRLAALLAGALGGVALLPARAMFAVGDAENMPSPIAVVATAEPLRVASPTTEAALGGPDTRGGIGDPNVAPGPVSALPPEQIASPAADLGR